MCAENGRSSTWRLLVTQTPVTFVQSRQCLVTLVRRRRTAPAVVAGYHPALAPLALIFVLRLQESSIDDWRWLWYVGF